MKLFEYMAARRPIIAAKTPAIQAIVSEKEVLFYEPDNALSLASEMQYAETHAGLLQKMVDDAYVKAQSLAWKLRADRIIDFIKT